MKEGISGAALKWVAIITMLVDHFAVAVYVNLPCWSYGTYNIMRKIGRISFPLYCFLLVEGFFHTKDLGKYIRKCLIFAVISEIPFNMAIYGRVFYVYRQNIYFTLALGLMCLGMLDKLKYRYEMKFIIYKVMIILSFAGLAQCLEVDYRWKGILYIVVFYYCYSLEKWKRIVIGIVTFSHEITAMLAFIPIWLYNGKRGYQPKYFFYILYPLHLAIYGIIRFYLQS